MLVRESRGLKYGRGVLLRSVFDSVRVCMKGTFRVGEIKGSATPESLLLLVVAVVAWLVRLSMIEDLLRLWALDVRLSSRGLASGGSLLILRKMTVR